MMKKVLFLLLIVFVVRNAIVKAEVISTNIMVLMELTFNNFPGQKAAGKVL